MGASFKKVNNLLALKNEKKWALKKGRSLIKNNNIKKPLYRGIKNKKMSFEEKKYEPACNYEDPDEFSNDDLEEDDDLNDDEFEKLDDEEKDEEDDDDDDEYDKW